MEGVVEFIPFWAGYLLFAVIGYWCWKQLFFWLPAHTDVRRFFNVLGVVLLFTPAPIEPGSSYFAPAFIVLPFTVLLQGVAEAMYAVTWLLGGLCLGLLMLGVRQLLRWAQSEPENNN